MHRFVFFAALVALPATAQTIRPMPPPDADYADISLEQLGNALRSLSDKDDICSHAFPLVAEVAKRRPDVVEIKRQATVMEIICASQRGDDSFAYRLLQSDPEAIDHLDPIFGLYLVSFQGDGRTLTSQLRNVLIDGSDETAVAIQPDLLSFASQRASDLGVSDALDEVALETLKAGRLAKFDPEVRETLAFRALRASTSRPDLPAARAALAELSHPTVFAGLLGEKRFASLWPAIEERVGEHYSRVTTEHLADAMAQYREKPEDLNRLNQAAHALYYHGRFAEVVAFAEAATQRPDLATTLHEDEAWTLNLKAYSLDALGRQAEADAVFDVLAESAQREPSWGVNFVINRAIRLVGQKRWSEGLAAATAAKAISDKAGNDYAKALVAKAHICALHGLGRDAELAPHLALLESGRAKNPIQLAAGLQCLGRTDQAAVVLVGALGNEETRSPVLEDLQPKAFDLFYTRSLLPQPRDLLETHPALRTEFLEHARFISETFYPGASLKR